MLKIGTKAAQLPKGIHKWDFRYSVEGEEREGGDKNGSDAVMKCP
jgi:hypothetical protein